MRKMATKNIERTIEILSCSDLSDKTSPPWCSSRKVCQKRKLVKKLGNVSSYPLRENVWQYLYENDEKFKSANKRNKGCKRASNFGGKMKIVFVLLILGVVGYVFNLKDIPNITDCKSYLRLTTKFVDFGEWKPSMSEECCHKMKYLSLELSRAEHILRNTLRARSYVLTSRTSAPETSHFDSYSYIEGIASKGPSTTEWGGRVALWGVVPLWRAAPPPGTVLAKRRPTPSDCWPFSGNSGELVIELSRARAVRGASVEHVKPDTASSAPRRFALYGISVNSTVMKLIESEYKQSGPAKQYYDIHNEARLHAVIFKVLSNHGNTKYTCIYRVHLYGSGNVIH